MGAIVSRKAPMLGDRTRRERAITVIKRGSAHRPPAVGSVCGPPLGCLGTSVTVPLQTWARISFWPSWSTSNWELVFLSVLLFFHCSFNLSCKSWTQPTQLSTHGKGEATVQFTAHDPSRIHTHVLGLPLGLQAPLRPSPALPRQRAALPSVSRTPSDGVCSDRLVLYVLSACHFN